MTPKQEKKLMELLSRFARETQASSFAVENLGNRIMRIMEEDTKEE